MAMIITHNISALNTQRQLSMTNRALGSSLEKLSSGYRINTGKDGPADLIISEQLRAQNMGLERAVRNTSEAMNVIGIAEGALNEMNEILKKMRQLALHAANSGITSPTQVEADQSEIDSAIQTIDRIANTTKYSDQMLLNGNKSLTFTRDTSVDYVMDHALLDLGASRIDQVFKTKGYSVTLAYTGGVDTDANDLEDTADITKSARRAYFEAYESAAGTDVTNAAITADQRFIVSGAKGSRGFSFGTGTHLGDITNAINNLSDSTGVGAQLIFDSGVTGTAVTATNTGPRNATGEASYYNMTQSGAASANGVSAVTIGGATGAVEGLNTDGDGRIWLRFTSATDYIAYKDRDMTMEVGRGTTAAAMTASNSSGLANITLTTAGATAGDVTMIDLGSQFEFSDAGSTAGMTVTNLDATLNFDVALGSAVSGVRLGYNTDSTGNIYFRVDATDLNAADIYFYKDSSMTDQYLVAKTEGVDITSGGAQSIQVIAENLNDGAGPSSGLFITLAQSADATAAAVYDGQLTFTDLGIRLYSTEYGSDQSVTVDAKEGKMWTYYDQPDSIIPTVLDAGATGQSKTIYGADATVSINGLELALQGTSGSISTQDINAKFVFDQGIFGLTTIAQQGYDTGALASRAQQINTLTNFATNAIGNTSEKLYEFQGGMQFQLGEGAGDQERTVYSIQSMAVANMGRTSFYDDFEGLGLFETKNLTLEDVLGGGLASLGSDPVKALGIIDKAIEDVSSLRARLGATQSNLLQTNANSLRAAIENIQKTESAIRDTDMAAETTEFTKNQILVSAGTSMLAQANVMAQNVLQLLG